MSGNPTIKFHRDLYSPQIELYPSRFALGGKWRWRTRCKRNGKVLARSSEGYHNRAHCVSMIARHFGAFAKFVEVAK